MKVWLLGMAIHTGHALFGLASAYALQHPLIGLPPELGTLVGVVAQQLSMHSSSYLGSAFDQATK